jgi:SWI/SNF-related matrix-associated actin-dependent regulator of chromatin subfamily D
VAERIMPHLHPLSPIKLNYTIRVDQDFQTAAEGPKSTVYDVRITVEDPLRAKVMAITSNPQTAQNLRQISSLDDQLAVIIQAIQHHKAKHTFYKNFSRDPVAFLKKWYSSQQRDLSVILGEIERGDVAGLEFAKGGKEGVWGSDIVEEAVRYKLARAEASR